MEILDIGLNLGMFDLKDSSHEFHVDFIIDCETA